MSFAQILVSASNVTINSVGFGTAALGQNCHNVVLMALEAGFRYFDTAEENQYWYNSYSVGTALREYAQQFIETSKTNDNSDYINDDECVMIDEDMDGQPICLGRNMTPLQAFCYEIHISTKIPPWELTSNEHIRSNAAQSRNELVSFCDTPNTKMPLDIYYIHAPACWKGWHTRCDNPPPTLDLRSAWLAMEAVVGIDRSARRIGLSNVREDELLDIIRFVQERQAKGNHNDGTAPPRLPDVVQSHADPISSADAIRKICNKYNIEFVSYSTLGTQHIYKSKLQTNPVLTHPIIIELANKYQRSTAEIVLSWAIQNKMSIIPRSSQKEHIIQLARLLPNVEFGPTPVTGSFLSSVDLARVDELRNSI
jgi:diketogulonate reductase-like aldo/keto reductase